MSESGVRAVGVCLDGLSETGKSEVERVEIGVSLDVLSVTGGLTVPWGRPVAVLAVPLLSREAVPSVAFGVSAIHAKLALLPVAAARRHGSLSRTCEGNTNHHYEPAKAT